MQFFSQPRPGLRALALPLLLSASLLSVTGVVAPAFADDLTHLTITAATAGTNQQISLGLNKSLIVDLPADAREVIVSQPTIASASMRSTRRAVLQGVGVGDTNMIFLDSKGSQIASLAVSVARDDSTLSRTLAAMLPGSHISVQGFGDRVIISSGAGGIAGRCRQGRCHCRPVLRAGDTNVANLVTVSGAQQVSLKVTVAEVDRSAVKQLGIDLTGSLTVGALTGTLASPSVLGGASGVANGNSIGAGVNVLRPPSLQATLRALEQRKLCCASSMSRRLRRHRSQPAELKAGGQVPEVISLTSTTAQSITYQNVGVDLKFTLTVKSNGMISLVVDSAVSAPSTINTAPAAISVSPIARPAAPLSNCRPARPQPIGGPFEDEMRQGDQLVAGNRQHPDPGRAVRSRDFVHTTRPNW